MADFGWGTGSATAQSATISFWINTSLTVAQTYSVTLQNSSLNQMYVAPFTIVAGNNAAWNQIVIVVPPAPSGTWATDNTLGAYIEVALMTTVNSTVSNSQWTSGAGNVIGGNTASTNFMATSGNVLNITGWQFEKEHRLRRSITVLSLLRLSYVSDTFILFVVVLLMVLSLTHNYRLRLELMDRGLPHLCHCL